MPSARIRPTRQTPNYKRIAVTGAGGSAVTAMSDQSDATFVRRKASKAPMARFVLATPALPAAHDIATIVPGARLKQPTSRPPKIVTLAMSVPGSGKPVNKIAPTVTGPVVRAGSGTTTYDYATPAGAGKTAGPTGPWSGLLSVLAVRVNDGHTEADANRATIYELWADVYYCARPTAALAVAPTSPVTTTSYPEITATLSALVESWQDNSGAPARSEIAWELKVFSSAQYGAGGFDPETSPCVWSSQGLTAPLDYIDGVTASSEAIAEAPPDGLPNGTYRAYARGRRTFDAAQGGSWALLTFTINIAPTPPPTLAAVLEDAAQRVALTVTANSAAGASSPLLTVERSDDGGSTWTLVRGAYRLPSTFGVPATIHDYEAARGTALQYRASCEATFTAQQLLSGYGTASPAGTLSAAAWNLKVPLDPSMNLLGAPIDADPEWTQQEDAVTFRPVGRRFPVVVSMALGGADGSLSASTSDGQVWEALEALREYAGTLLLESPFGWARYIRVVSRSWSETGAAGSPHRRVSFAFLEVGAP